MALLNAISCVGLLFFVTYNRLIILLSICIALCLAMLRYFNFEASFKLRWCRVQDLFRSQIPVTTGGL